VARELRDIDVGEDGRLAPRGRPAPVPR
jgi:hypothetical protein